MEINSFYQSLGYIILAGIVGMITLFVIGLVKERKIIRDENQ